MTGWCELGVIWCVILPMTGAASQIAAEGAGNRQTMKMTMLRQGMILGPSSDRTAELLCCLLLQQALRLTQTLTLSSDL